MGTQTLTFLCNQLGKEPAIAGRKDLPELFRLLGMVLENQGGVIKDLTNKLDHLGSRVYRLETEGPPTKTIHG